MKGMEKAIYFIRIFWNWSVNLTFVENLFILRGYTELMSEILNICHVVWNINLVLADLGLFLILVGFFFFPSKVYFLCIT